MLKPSTGLIRWVIKNLALGLGVGQCCRPKNLGWSKAVLNSWEAVGSEQADEPEVPPRDHRKELPDDLVNALMALDGIMQAEDQVEGQVEDQAEDQVEDQAEDQVEDQEELAGMEEER
ncbi:hypothetical protein HPP92_007690 [Vanilla planifolia]|uniref:Uncharacterized protein n=1 Tax=Vanilla planifolia TaxID=51239 RepID=A0A835RRN6_VANPL|nr:hypothetical protein HPP92_007690 [Vanilla planifolia]